MSILDGVGFISKLKSEVSYGFSFFELYSLHHTLQLLKVDFSIRIPSESWLWGDS